MNLLHHSYGSHRVTPPTIRKYVVIEWIST